MARSACDGHPVFRVRFGPAVGYFLRLADGNASGAGFAGTGFQSLKRLAAGDIEALSAVDGSTAYRGWGDLIATVREILRYERAAAPLVQINLADPDPMRNPADHSDHLLTANSV